MLLSQLTAPLCSLSHSPATSPVLSSGSSIRMLHPFSRVIAIHLGSRNKSRCQRILGCFRTRCVLLLLWTPHVFFSIWLFACNLSHAICPTTLPVILNPLKNNVGLAHLEFYKCSPTDSGEVMSPAFLNFLPAADHPELVRWDCQVVSHVRLAPSHQMAVPVGLLSPSSASTPFFLVLRSIHSVWFSLSS